MKSTMTAILSIAGIVFLATSIGPFGIPEFGLLQAGIVLAAPIVVLSCKSPMIRCRSGVGKGEILRNAVPRGENFWKWEQRESVGSLRSSTVSEVFGILFSPDPSA